MKRGFALAALVAITVVPSAGAHSPGHTTLDHSIAPQNPSAAYSNLTVGDPFPRQLRDGASALGTSAQSGRETRRESLFYFGQLTDFQISDEESPARVEFVDVDGSPVNAAHRPQEALVAVLVDQAIRAVNDLGTSPHGTGAELDLTLVTGDQADNMQENEVKWVVGLLEGGRIDPNSGVEDNLPICGKNGEAAGYTGVQDYDDYVEGDFAYYDPDQPQGKWSAFPLYPGLMDRAQGAFTAEGADAPTYVTNGNHDSLAQGNAWANAVYETIALGCSKPMNFAPGQPSPSFLSTSPQNTVDVPRDPARRYVTKQENKALHDTDAQADAHGYAYVDPAENAASNGAATYYSFSPKPGLRLISLDTVSEGGTIGDSANGNIDDPQFRWLAGELDEAEAAGDLVFVMGHHPIRSLTSETPDEAAPQCLGVANEPNPGCDPDPRNSQPIRHGSDLRDLLLEHPMVVAYVSGHTHEHKLLPFKRADGSGGFWELNTSSIVDWPVQGRVAELVDNNDGTLSILSTVFDHNGPITAEPAGTNALGLDEGQLAAIGRTLAYNDPGTDQGVAEGLPGDRNVELVLPDPR